MGFIGLGVDIVVGSLIMWLFGRSQQAVLQQQLQVAIQQTSELEVVKAENTQLQIKLAEMKKEKEANTERLARQEEYKAELQTSFQALAAQVMQSNSDEFRKQSQVQIEAFITLLALLKAIAYGWQQFQLTENTRAILNEGHELYKRMAKFLEHLQNVGKSLEQAVNHYNGTVGSFEGRLKPSLRKFEEMGLSQGVLKEPASITTAVRMMRPIEVKD